MLNNFFRVAVGVAVLGAAVAASAHRAWILPAATVLSSEDPWVTFDAAISNDIFHTDYHALKLDTVKVIGPKGTEVELQNPATGKYRSTFDLNLTERGTYKVFMASNNLTARWETADGKRGFYPGRGEAFSEEGFATQVPKDAKDLQIAQSSRRMETFVTAGVPDKKALAASNVGLELVPVTHPNDLYAGEKAKFQFLIDGKPAAGTEITVIPGGMRYRTSQDEITAKTDNKGMAEITWPAAGMYWMEAEYSDDKARAPATTRRGAYVATFEVLPQ